MRPMSRPPSFATTTATTTATTDVTADATGSATTLTRRSLLLAGVSLLVAACGFKLRGSRSFSWTTIYLDMPANSSLRHKVKRGVEAGGVSRVVAAADEAQLVLQVLADEKIRDILSLNADGLVREFRLTRSFSYLLRTAAGEQAAPPANIIVQRDMNFDDTRLLAKEREEDLIWSEMEGDLAQQLLRRLAQLQPAAVAAQH